jgi:hypothetical protein
VSQSTRRHNPPTAPAPRTPRARARRCSQGGRLGRTRSGPSQTWHLPGTIALSHAALSSNRIQPEHHRARQPSPTVSAPNPGAPPTRLPRKPGREGTATVHPRSPPFHLPRSALHSSPQSSGLMLRPQAARGRQTCVLLGNRGADEKTLSGEGQLLIDLHNVWQVCGLSQFRHSV